MTEVGVNLGFLFTELPLPSRFRAAVDSGCPLVELPWPEDAAAVMSHAARVDAQVVLLNVDAGDLGVGWRGYAHLPPLRGLWRNAFLEAAGIARDVGIPRLNVLAGIADRTVPATEQLDCLAENLAWATDQLSGTGIGVVVEQLNEAENPGYLLSDPAALRSFLERLGGGVRAQLDIHHLTHAGGDLAQTIALFDGLIGHVQVSDQPGRSAPGTGELDWPRTLSSFAGAGYRGPWMLEYQAAAGESFTSVPEAVAVLRQAESASTTGGRR
jgi:hydroxypyruvate isomerase